MQSVMEANLADLRVATLSSSLASNKREVWLRSVGPNLEAVQFPQATISTNSPEDDEALTPKSVSLCL